MGRFGRFGTRWDCLPEAALRPLWGGLAGLGPAGTACQRVFCSPYGAVWQVWYPLVPVGTRWDRLAEAVFVTPMGRFCDFGTLGTDNHYNTI